MSPRPVPPTEQEVLAALEKITTYEDGGWRPANRVDVADAIARDRGWNGQEGYQHSGAGTIGTRSGIIGRYVSITAVTKILGKLDAETKAYALYGHHRFIATAYGVNPNVVYYLSQTALDRLIQERRARWVQAVEMDALEAAQQRVLAEHPDDVEKYRQENRTAGLAAEPDWHAQLNDDPEEENR